MAENLPLGLQDFLKIILYDFPEVDKTVYLYNMVSRPRRFGKSLTVSTLSELYKGSRELFKGLWIEDGWDWSRKHSAVYRTNLKHRSVKYLYIQFSCLGNVTFPARPDSHQVAGTLVILKITA